MQVDRISITVDPALGQALRSAAAAAGISLSRWLSDAAADHLRNQRLGEAMKAWQTEHGDFTAAELDAAASTLGVDLSEQRVS
jgi:hypothetical protein